MMTSVMLFLLAKLCAQLVLLGEVASGRASSVADVNGHLDTVHTILDSYDFNIAATFR